jgi:translation initiation factor 2 subunit 2
MDFKQTIHKYQIYLDNLFKRKANMSDDESNKSDTKSVGEEEEEADIAAMLDLSKKKKKAKKKKESKKESKEKSEKKESDEGNDDGVDFEEQRARLAEEVAKFDLEFPDEYDRKADYTYPDLLDRVVDILTSNNPDLTDKKRRTMKPPQLTRVGTKKTLWVNYQEICTMMQRPPEHVFQFFMAELGTEGSIDGSQRLVIRGKYVPKYIESLLRKYIVEYVTCQMCRSANTELTKDSSTRLQFVNCKDCGSNRSVAAIRSGYHATSRADRRAARNAM